MMPDHRDLWFLPLGGCGEIGMNLSLYGHDGQWLMIDCGATFRDADGTRRSGYPVQLPDPAFIEARRDRLTGLLLTHGHEDHIGAIAWLWPRLRCPVYATRFTAELASRKLAEHGLLEHVPLHVVEPGTRHHLGVFDIEWIAHNHSIPEPSGIVVRTPLGSVFHTADWKLDAGQSVPRGGPSGYRRLGDEGIDVMVCDSTGALQPGHSLPESSLESGLQSLVDAADGRIVVGCFGSNIARVDTLQQVARQAGRHLGLLGRSLQNTVSAARVTGHWPHRETLVDPSHIGYLPRETVLLVATGSQGEPGAALDRLSRGGFRSFALSAGDTVILSARAIPGNEAEIDAMLARFARMGVATITPSDAPLPIHASGHPARDELRQLYDWVRPGLLIPVHGEGEHLAAHCQLARECGIQRQLTGRNGDLFILAPNKALRRDAVKTRRLGVARGATRLETIAEATLCLDQAGAAT